jgi:hypothetical protein
MPMKEPGITLCCQCVYWEQIKPEKGLCRAHPPMLLLSMCAGDSLSPDTYWPPTDPDDGCGEGIARQ